MILSLISLLLRSRVLFFNLISSFVSIPGSIGKGGVSEADKILRDSASISISPVFKSLLTAPLLFTTVPVTAITNSERMLLAFSNTALSDFVSSNIIWTIPLTSLKSINNNEPKFLLFWTHPITVTFSPILLLLNSAHLYERLMPCIDSCIFSSIQIELSLSIHYSQKF